MGRSSKLKLQKRLEREKTIELLKNQSKQYDEIYNNNNVHTMLFNMNQKTKIKNNKPDYITFYNEDTGKVIRTFSMDDLTKELLKDTNTKIKEAQNEQIKEDDTNKALNAS